MKIALTLPLAAAVIAGALSVSNSAYALGPIGIEAGAKVGAGTNPTADTINPFGFGLGARAGVSVFGIYGGLSYMYYFGGNADIAGTSAKRTGKAMLYGGEAGYSINILGLVTIRPLVGVGQYVGNFNPASPGPGASNDSAGDKTIYVEPGVTVIIPFGLWFVGADANLMLLPGQSGSGVGFTFHGQIGVKF